MAKHRHNPRLAKIHRSYTVDEIAGIYSIHKNTVRTWIKNGLLTCDDRRPTLILGRDLRTFLEGKRTKNKRPCTPGMIYCLRCREPKTPYGRMVDYIPVTETKGNLIGVCPCCDSVINQFTSLKKIITHSESFRRNNSAS